MNVDIYLGHCIADIRKDIELGTAVNAARRRDYRATIDQEAIAVDVNLKINHIAVC